MNDKFVLALTGPTGAGKSTVAEKIAQQVDRCTNIEVDHVKNMIVSGFYLSEEHPNDRKKWRFNEWELLGDSIGLIARNFHRRDYSVIINGFMYDAGWEHLQQYIKITHKILLLPRISTVIRRDKLRHDDFVLGEMVIQRHYDHFTSAGIYKDFTKLDSTHLSAEATVDKILSITRKTYEALQHAQ